MTGSTSASFSGFGAYAVDAGVRLTLTGINDLTTGQSLTVAGSLINTGVLTGPSASGYGVILTGAGSVTNGSATDTSASVAGFATGVFAGGAPAAIANYGAISGEIRDGVALYGGGSVTNGSATDVSASIAGLGAGVSAGGASAAIANFGTISGKIGDGVNLGSGGTVTNGSAADHTASIAGSVGVGLYGSAGLTVTNFGTISGSGGTAIKFDVAADRLVVESSAAFTGALIGAGGTLELAGGNDTINGLGEVGAMTGSTSASFSGFGAYAVDAGVRLTLTGINDLTTGQSLTVAGSLINTGTLTGPSASGYGVILTGAGSVTNGSAADTSASVAGFATGVFAGGASAAIANFGTILGKTGDGVALYDGGVLTNGSATDTTANITGSTGIGASRGKAKIANFGAITGASGYGVNLASGGTVTNGSAADTTASIAGTVGVYIQDLAATVTNFGVISGSGGTAVNFNGTASLLLAEAGSKFAGIVNAGSGAMDVVSGAATFTAGVLSDGKIKGAGTLALGGGTSTFGKGASLTIAEVTVAGAATVVDATTSLTYVGLWDQTAGTLSVAAGDDLAFTGSGDRFAGTLAGAGTVALSAGSDTLAATTLKVAHVDVSGAVVAVAGAIANASELYLSGGKLIVANAGATLSGSGDLVMSNLAANQIIGASAAATLTLGQTLEGAGEIGAGQMTLVVQAAGKIAAKGNAGLTLDTGANTIANAGIIESVSGGLEINSAVSNGGRLLADGSTLTVGGAVTGSGYGEVVNGVLKFAASSSFNQKVVFAAGATGTLELAHSQAYTASITGFSTTGATALDLDDITFISGTTKATYSGTTSGGVLTVTDGTHTAKIHFTGNYTNSSWTLSAGPGTGTKIVDPTGGGQLATPLQSAHGFIQAIAGMNAGPAGVVGFPAESWRPLRPALSVPRTSFA